MIPESLVSTSGDRLAGTNPASPSTRSHRPDAPDAGLQGVLQRPLHVHDRKQSQERALLRQVYRLLPDADDRQSGEFMLSLCTYLHQTCKVDPFIPRLVICRFVDHSFVPVL